MLMCSMDNFTAIQHININEIQIQSFILHICYIKKAQYKSTKFIHINSYISTVKIY